MEPWTGAQRALAMKAFYKNGDSFVIARREFRRVRDSSQLCRSISTCHQDLGLKLRGYWFYTKEEGGSVKTVRTPENIAVEREAIKSPHRSARRHSVSLGLSEIASLQKLQHPTQFRS